MKIGYKQIILQFLRKNPEKWFASHDLQQKWLDGKWVGSSGSRRARELAEDGTIQVKHTGAYAEYSAHPPIKVIEYRDPTTKELRHREVIYK